MYIDSKRLGMLYVRRSQDHDAVRPDGREPRCFEVFAQQPGEWAAHLGRIEVLYTTPRECARLERRRLGPQLRVA